MLSVFSLHLPPPNPSTPNTEEWLYNEIMRHVEPDLMLNHLPLLDEKYANETPVEHLQRMKNYEDAYRIFDKAKAEITAELEKMGGQVQAESRRTALVQERAGDSDKVKAIEELIASQNSSL